MPDLSPLSDAAEDACQEFEDARIEAYRQTARERGMSEDEIDKLIEAEFGND